MPPMPYEDAGACPFEGCVYRDWQANNAVAVRTTRAADAPTVFTVRKGDTITALAGVVVTTSPGQVRFREPADLTWWEFGTVNLGQSNNEYHPDGIAAFVRNMWARGISQQDTDRMTKENPAKFLGIPVLAAGSSQ